jgi:hypothetical protein
MRNILFIVLLFFTCGVFAQAVEEKSPTNYNSNTLNAPVSIPSEVESVSDTAIFQIDSKSKKSSGAVRTKSLEKADKNQIAPTSAASVQSASQSFTQSRTTAAQSRSQRTPSVQVQNQMNEVVEQLSVTAPESFEYHFYSYQAGNYNIDLIEHLNKAEALRPNNSDVHIQKASYHLIKKEDELAKGYLEKLKISTRLNKDVISYTEDLLLSVPEKGTLITHGFDDSYGTYYNQLVQQIRQDVQVVSLDFLQSKQYRTNLKDQGYVLPKREIIDVAYLKEFCSLNESKGLSVSTTVPKEYLTGIAANLYVSGLILEYRTEQEFDNFNRNEILWESKLKKTLISGVISEKGRQLSANYLPMLLHLRQVYQQKSENEKMKQIDEAIDQIAVQSNKYEQVKKLKQSF